MEIAASGIKVLKNLRTNFIFISLQRKKILIDVKY
jgi:hypothetical protein